METIDLVQVREFLQNNFDNQVSAVQHIGTGWWSHAYAFTVGQQSFIVRVSIFEEDFQKDAFAYRRFSSPTLPIPKVIQIGRFDDTRYFAITERCAGRIIAAMDEADIYSIIPELFDIAGEIHRIDVSPFSGWGLTDVYGNGRFESWHQYLLSLYDQKFTFDLHDLARSTFFELDVYETYLEQMKQLLPYCPSEKYLVHGDYGFDNVVSDGPKITGVLDWADDLLGDFIYDIAYLDFWSVEDIPYGALWQNYAAARGEHVPHFEERMRCYMLYLGLRTLPAAAIKGNRKFYDWTTKRLQSIMRPGRR